jgi:hypothetical protein
MIVILLRRSGSTATGTNYCCNFLRVCIKELVVQSYIYSFPLLPSQYVNHQPASVSIIQPLGQSFRQPIVILSVSLSTDSNFPICTCKSWPFRYWNSSSNIHKLIPYLTGNTSDLRYKDPQVNAVEGEGRCLLWEPNETHKYTLWAGCRVLVYLSKWYTY